MLHDLEKLKKYQIKYLQTTDLVMPREYFSTLLLLLAAKKNTLDIFYEQKLSLTFTKLKILKKANLLISYQRHSFHAR